jgi:hypothetical protein
MGRFASVQECGGGGKGGDQEGQAKTPMAVNIRGVLVDVRYSHTE